MEEPRREDDGAEDLLRRALLDDDATAAVALRVDGLPLSESLTVIFHGRRDLGTIQTYVAQGAHGAGDAVHPSELLRVPCDLDLADAEDREEAERLYADQARVFYDALVGADTVLDIWREPLEAIEGGRVTITRAVEPPLSLPAHRLMPVALVAPEHGIVVAPVCGARTLAAGKPPLGIACAQADFSRVFPLPDDPGRCLEEFAADAAEHAHRFAERLAHQEASVQRFLELNGDDLPEAG